DCSSLASGTIDRVSRLQSCSSSAGSRSNRPLRAGWLCDAVPRRVDSAGVSPPADCFVAFVALSGTVTQPECSVLPDSDTPQLSDSVSSGAPASIQHE